MNAGGANEKLRSLLPPVAVDSWLAIAFFALGAALRLMLSYVNPPQNAFDDHFEPIFLIMNTGLLPAKDACYQCYHPPVFYWISAMIGNLAVSVGATMSQMVKLLQLVSCSYGIATVGVCYLILQQFPLSSFARLLSFGTVCFLPRHIYMSAMNSNDTLSYLFVALTIYLAIVALKRKFSPTSVATLSVVLTVTLFVKYTTFAVIPAVLVAFLLAAYRDRVVPRRRAVAAILITIALPLVVLASQLVSNVRQYGSPLPANLSIYDPTLDRPRDPEAISYLSFKPWEDIRTPFLAPGKLHSFWTLVYGSLWFDTEPVFIRFLDSNTDAWRHYHRWYTGREPFPIEAPPLPPLTSSLAAGLLTLGLAPLALILVGFYRCVSGRWSALVDATAAQVAALGLFPVLLAFNAAGIIALSVQMPVYTSMKGSYFLASTPSFMIFLALGVTACERSSVLKRTLAIVFSALFALSIAHILQIVMAFYALGFAPGVASR